MKYINKIKSWANDNPKIIKITILIVILIAFIPIIRLSIISASTQNEEDNDNQHKVELSSEQQKIYDDYNSEQKSIQALLVNNRWVNAEQTSNCIFTDKEFKEIMGKKEDTKKYVICDINKKDVEGIPFLDRVYKLVLLDENNKYFQMELELIYFGKEERSGIDKAEIRSEKLFMNSHEYGRTKPVETIQIRNWDNNVNQFIDNKYDEMVKQLYDYIYIHYPQTGEISWAGKVKINYPQHMVELHFGIPLPTNHVYLWCGYSKDKGTWSIENVTNEDANPKNYD